ncbi:MAG: ABC transporter ATP-binding protein [Cellulosilyticaceae bacterium]
MARNKFDEDEKLEVGFNMKQFKRLLDYTKPYKKPIFTCMGLMVFASCVSLLAPIFIKVALDDYIPNKAITSLIGLSVLYLMTNVIISLVLRHRTNVMGEVGQNILVDIRADLFKHLQELPFTYFDSRPHGKILVRIVNYVNSLSDLLTNGIINLVADTVSLIITVIFMFYLDVRLTFVSLIGIPLLMGVMFTIKNAQRKAFQKLSSKQSNMNAYVHESIEGMKVTQSFVREEENREINKEVCEEYSSAWLSAVKLNFLIWPSIETISVFVVGIIYVFALLIGKTTISVGVLIAFVSYVWRFWGPITNIGNFYNNIINAMAYLERIFEMLDEKNDIIDPIDAVELKDIKGDVTFEDVVFSYEKDQPILKGISFDIKAGERIAIVGPTGSGKTTIISLISRFYDINEGIIRIDGTDIATCTLNSLRSKMGMMLQDSFVFSGTIRDNIRYGKLDATEEEIIKAAKAVQAHDFIDAFENGYDTLVNERGSTLSAGQRQLISFARTLLSDPNILILDEATSSIDSQTEVLLQKGLDSLLKGRTSFIIAHRLSTIKNSDRIIYIDQGRITECGNHDMLMALKGDYYDLYMAQFKILNK